LINNFSANNTPPSEKIPIFAVEFLINHGSVASMTLHDNLLMDKIEKPVLELFHLATKTLWESFIGHLSGFYYRRIRLERD